MCSLNCLLLIKNCKASEQNYPVYQVEKENDGRNDVKANHHEQPLGAAGGADGRGRDGCGRPHALGQLGLQRRLHVENPPSVLQVFGHHMGHNDEEQKEDAVEEPYVNHLDVGGDGERVGGAVEEGVEHEEGGETHGQTDLHGREKVTYMIWG